MIRFECPHCGKGLRTDNDTIGEAFNCPSCRGRVRVPESGVEFVAERRAGTSGRFAVRPFDEAIVPFGWGRALIWAMAGAALLGGIATQVTYVDTASMMAAIAISAAMGAVFGFMAARLFRPRHACVRCRRSFNRRELGTIERDAQSAGEALATGDLPALRALSPEGATVHVAVQVCPRCGPEAPIGVRFTALEADKVRELAHVIYPGAALGAFERLCKKSPG